ncbi:MAG: hypothetical protein DYG92_01120 [Leptolyngbya sp. PLA1]|nr:hypothetical protein [Leptolyngbya sp. PLA1]
MVAGGRYIERARKGVPVTPTKADGEHDVPLLIGVVGHRDLANAPELEDQVTAFLGLVRKQVPHTRVILLSSMAAGADLLTVRVATALQMAVVPVLAVPKDLFERTFSPGFEEEVAEFRRLLALCEDPIVLPAPEGTTYDAVMSDKGLLDRQYAAAGAYVVRLSHTVIALWDGVETTDIAGTAAAIRYAECGVPSDLWDERDPLDLADGAAVRWLMAERKAPKKGPARPYCDWIYPLSYPRGGGPASPDRPDAAAGVRRLASLLRDGALDRLDEFNREARDLTVAARSSERVHGELAAHVRSLLPEGSTFAASAAQRRVAEIRARADYLAGGAKQQGEWYLRCALGLVVAAVLALELFAHVWHDRLWVLGLYAVALLAAVHFLDKRGRCFTRFVDYRALAEALRVQFFWSAAGLTDSVSRHFMRTHRTEVEWIRQAAAAVEVENALSFATPAQDGAGMNHARRVWIQGQLDFFRGRSEPLAAKGRTLATMSTTLARIGAWLVFGTLFVGWLIGWGPGESEHGSVHTGVHPAAYITVTLALLLVGAEVVRVYAESGEYTTNARRYLWMTSVYEQAERVLAECGPGGSSPDAARAAATVRSLGKAALAENSEWIVLHRHRPVELPHSIVNSPHHS